MVCGLLNHHMVWIICDIFHIAEVRTCWQWTSYYLCLPICTAYVNYFVASVYSLHLLFLEGFEYHRQIMILLSPLFSNLYQINLFYYFVIYISIIIRNRRGPSTDPWGTPLLTWDSLDVVPLAATHCCLFDKKLWIHTPILPLIPIFWVCSVICRGWLYQTFLQNLSR